MLLRVVVSVLPPRRAVVVLEAASPTSHKRPPLPSVAVADLLAKTHHVAEDICLCRVPLADGFSCFTGFEEVAGGVSSAIADAFAFLL